MPHEPAKRITLICAGKPKLRFILTEPPYPEIGDAVNWKNSRYHVWAIEDTEVLLRIPVRGESPDAT